jgi:hypothetical protein
MTIHADRDDRGGNQPPVPTDPFQCVSLGGISHTSRWINGALSKPFNWGAMKLARRKLLHLLAGADEVIE